MAQKRVYSRPCTAAIHSALNILSVTAILSALTICSGCTYNSDAGLNLAPSEYDYLDSGIVEGTAVARDPDDTGDTEPKSSGLIGYFKEHGYTPEDNEYPEFYAGAYIDPIYGTVLCITDDSEEVMDILRDATGLENPPVKLVKYSYDELKKASKQIFDLQQEERDAGIEPAPYVISSGVRIKENCLYITIEDPDGVYASGERSIADDMKKYLPEGFDGAKYSISQNS